MTIPEFSNLGWTSPVFNHLWQSSIVLLVAWLVTFALRRNPARIRYAVWMLASVKFLVPFALLSDLGARWIRPVTGRTIGSALYTTVDEMSRPFQTPALPGVHTASSAHPVQWPVFAPSALAAIWLCGFLLVLVRSFVRWRRVAHIAADALPVEGGRELDALRRAESNAGLRNPVALRASSRAIEPGVFGIVHPVLLWPAGISAYLDDAQIDSIVAHEVEHVRRRDNLTAAIHMIVEAMFWFHPAVRWIGWRLLEERERACDEKVLERNARPETYAQSILKVCAFCLEPPEPCVAGVSGSDLKRRVLRIMTHRSLVNLSLLRRVALGAAAVLLVAVPVGFGVLHAMQMPAADSSVASDVSPQVPRYEVSTIKPTASDEMQSRMWVTPDGVSLQGVPIQVVLREAFQFQDDRIVGAPGWVRTNRYDVEAKVSPEDAPKLEKLKLDQRRSMLILLLEERFHLKYHHEMRELPSYWLMVAKGGPKLKEAKQESAPGADGQRMPRGRMFMDRGRVQGEGVSLEFLAQVLSRQLGRSVIDKTGLTGNYDYTLQWTPDNASPPPGADPGLPRNDASSDVAGPSIFTALQEQLGLRLESSKGPVDVIVIDHIDLPSEN
jgi:bla regulator protein blaR1